MKLGMVADAAKQSFVEHLRTTRQTVKPSDPWMASLRNIQGSLGSDGIERISTERVFELLDLPRLKRTPEAAKRLRCLMVELGWTVGRRFVHGRLLAVEGQRGFVVTHARG
jgi:hypothetical protein